LTYKDNTVAGIQQIKLPSRIESVDEAALKADEFAKEQGLGDDFVSAIDLALRESVANAVKHGNKFAEEKTVDLTLARTDEGFEITVRDYGAGFRGGGRPAPRGPENLLKANGRGILFMRSFMDVVEWSHHADGGTIVRMIK